MLDEARPYRAWLKHLSETAPAAVKSYCLGGCSVVIRYLDESLFRLLHRALAHLETAAPAPAELTLHVYAASRPPVALSPDQWLEASRSWKSQPIRADRPHMHFVPGDDGRIDLLLGDHGEGCVGYRDPLRIPAWDVATPLRDLLHAWFRLRDGHIVHGAALGDDEGAVLLAGAGGSGKSSTALTCLLQSSLRYLGDDLCLLRREGEEVFVHSLFNSAKLRAYDVPRFARLQLPQHDDSVRGDGKPTFFAYPALRERLAASRPLKAILLPRVWPHEHSALSPASPGEAWKAIGPSTAALLPCDKHAWDWLGRLVQQVPAWRLHLGWRREAISSVVEQALRGEFSATRNSHGISPDAAAA